MMKRVFEIGRRGIYVNVRVKPGKPASRVVADVDNLTLHLVSPARDNLANQEATALLSLRLGLAGHQISITRGLTSRQKVLLIQSRDESETQKIVTRLKDLIQQDSPKEH